MGQPLREYLALDDYVLDLAITPNRGDAMSVLGIAREVAALTGKGLKGSSAAAPLTVSVEASGSVGVTAELSYEFTSELEVLEATDPATTIVEAWAPDQPADTSSRASAADSAVVDSGEPWGAHPGPERARARLCCGPSRRTGCLSEVCRLCHSRSQQPGSDACVAARTVAPGGCAVYQSRRRRDQLCDARAGTADACV